MGSLHSVLTNVYEHEVMKDEKDIVLRHLSRMEMMVFQVHQTVVSGGEVQPRDLENLLEVMFEIVSARRAIMGKESEVAYSYVSPVVDNGPLSMGDLRPDPDVIIDMTADSDDDTESSTSD